MTGFGILRPGLNGHHFTSNICKLISMNENCCISIQISPRFVPNGSINNKTS